MFDAKVAKELAFKAATDKAKSGLALAAAAAKAGSAAKAGAGVGAGAGASPSAGEEISDTVDGVDGGDGSGIPGGMVAAELRAAQFAAGPQHHSTFNNPLSQLKLSPVC